MPETAIITGALGQDAYYLSKQLLEKGYRVVGLVRRSSTAQQRVEQLQRDVPGLEIVYGDVTDLSSVMAFVKETQPTRVFNLAAVSFVPASWENPSLVIEVNTKGMLNVLEAVRAVAPEAHVAQASTSEMFGDHGRVTLSELSPLRPRSIYGASKVQAHHLCEIYRRSYGLFVSSVMMFNHESPRRPEHFVTRKITSWAARAAAGMEEGPLELGNLSAYRDWGFAGDYMRGMIAALDAEEPRDYVLATGTAHPIHEVIAIACEAVGVHPNFVSVPTAKRPWDVEYLRGDARKARMELGWVPKVSFEELITMMVMEDLRALNG